MIKQSTKDKAQGSVHELKGAIKREVGSLTNDPDLEAEGVVEKVLGKIQKKIGQAETVIEKP
jgi:uncharacterized protein YjbJ (UPF0337 family)